MIPQRITDYLRERRIRALARETSDHMAAGRTDEGRLAFQKMSAEIRARSPGQVRRMDGSLGLMAALILGGFGGAGVSHSPQDCSIKPRTARQAGRRQRSRP